VLLTSVLALSLSGLVVYHLADAGLVQLSGQSQGIMSILVIGAATDYGLLLVARQREELAVHESPYRAMRPPGRATRPPIAPTPRPGAPANPPAPRPAFYLETKSWPM
jgi:RND superfamily putative drug exporter